MGLDSNDDIFGSSLESFSSKGKKITTKTNPQRKKPIKTKKYKGITQKKNIFNKKDDINFDDDLFGKMGDELEDDSSFDISVGESDKKFQKTNNSEKSIKNKSEK